MDSSDRFSDLRERMVAEQIAGRGITHAGVLAAMRAVPREVFVPAADREYAYDDFPLPIPGGQTISQPYVVALMIEAVDPRPQDRALEIGAGSGYAAAVLGRLVAHVHSVERRPELVAYARERLARAGADNVEIHEGDGTLGWPAGAPYEVIIVTAGGPTIPTSLQEQLAVDGRLIMPVGRSRYEQELILMIRDDERHYRRYRLGPVAFVPLIGREGW